ncbi:MAG: ABC transporter permease, partial [Ferruginibacter sp.]
MTYKDSLSLSWKNIKGNRLRTAITVIIIALGIFALILIITVITAASNSLTTSFSTMGANAFSIRHKDRQIRFGGRRDVGVKKKSALKEKKSNIGIPISFEEARAFKDRYSFPGSKVSLALRGPGSIVVNTRNRKTNPDVNVYGGDENYLELNGYKINYGRNFSQAEIESGRNVCFIGSGVASKLFPENSFKAVDAVINVDHIPYRVIGVLEDKGSSAFFNTSKIIVTSVNNIRRVFATQDPSYNIGVMVMDLKTMNMATGEATGTFRPIRKLDVKDDDNFFID